MNNQEGLPKTESMPIEKKVAIQNKLTALAGIDKNDNQKLSDWINNYSKTFDDYTKFHPEISDMWDDESKHDEVLSILIEAHNYGYQEDVQAA